MNYKDFNLGDWIGYISGAIEDERELDGNEMRDLVEFLSTLEQEPRWIPVSEKLPESDEEYHTFLVTDNKGRVTLSEFYLSISDRKPYWSGMIDVIAWMPLPKPYKTESEVSNACSN